MFCAKGIVLDVGVPIYFSVGRFSSVDSDPFVTIHLS